MGLSDFRVVKADEGVTYEFPTLAMALHFVATAEDTEGQYSVFESIHQPGSGAPLHLHHREHETAYVVEGEFLIRMGDKPLQRVAQGTYVHFPKGQPHAFKCVGNVTGKLLFWMAPGGHERFFEKALQVVGSGPPDMEALTAVAKEFDVDIVGPFIEEDG